MKTTRFQVVAVLAVSLWVAGSVCQAQPAAAVETGAARMEWQFDTSASPLAPEVAIKAPAGAMAVVTPGKFGLGWQPELSTEMASASGVWDLGQSGSVTLSLGAAASGKTITVQVCQWLDGGIYADYATVAVAGATRSSVSTSKAASGLIGDWMIEQTTWQVAAGASADTVVITGLPSGTVIDKIAIAGMSGVVMPPVLTIKQIGGGSMEVSWPTAAGAGTVEGSSDPANPAGWVDTGLQPQTVGDQYKVIIEPAATMKFFRLRQ